MKKIEEVLKGLLLCLAIAIPSELLGTLFPVVGGAVFAIIAGMIVTLIIPDKTAFQPGIAFVSKKILQLAVIFLGFGLNLSVIVETGRQSLPIIISTITISLIIAWLIHKIMHVPANISTLIGIGSSICGGSAIAAAAPAFLVFFMISRTTARRIQNHPPSPRNVMALQNPFIHSFRICSWIYKRIEISAF